MSQNPPLKDPSVNDRDELLRRIRELEERCGQAEEALRTFEEQHRFLADSSRLESLSSTPRAVFSAPMRKCWTFWPGLRIRISRS